LRVEDLIDCSSSSSDTLRSESQQQINSKYYFFEYSSDCSVLLHLQALQYVQAATSCKCYCPYGSIVEACAAERLFHT
jgi:hypothetical protein